MNERLSPIAIVCACATLVAAGCATAPAAPPDVAMAAARRALADAQDAGGGEFAPGSLLTAQEKLDLGLAAARDRRYDDARRLAEEASVEAQLSAATARARKAQHAVNEVEATTQALKEEIARSARPY